MAERPRHWRLVLGWMVTLAVIAFAIAEWTAPDEAKVVTTTDEADDANALKITSISDAEVSPGDAVVVHFAGASPTPPLEARFAKKQAPIIARDDQSVVVQIPRDTPSGKAALRLIQGATRTKAWDIHVRPLNQKKLVGKLLGGLALFVFGLGLLATGLRGLAGDRLRTLLGKLTGSPARGVAVGALLGTGTQLTSSSAALTVGLVDARMLRVAPAVAVLVGAQLGASITGTLIPVQLSSESLLIIALGVAWSRLVRTRRGTAIANLILGGGLMLYGLHLLQTSVEPLVSDPQLLPYLDHLRSPTLQALLLCAMTGALLAFVLQGPGPVYVLVVGLAQTTMLLPLPNALAILAGTNLGAGVAVSIIAWQAGPTTRPLARTHLLFALSATAIVLATIPLWSAIATRVVPDAMSYGHSVLRTRIAAQLALAFGVAQLAVGACWLVVLPALTARVGRSRPVPRLVSGTPSLDGDLASALAKLRIALDSALEMAATSDRTRSAKGELALTESRTLLEGRLANQTEALVASLQLHRAVEQAVHVAELCIERGIRIGEEPNQRLTAMHAIANESFDAVIAVLVEKAPLDLEEAGAREIRMNSLEAEGRKATVLRKRRAADSTSSLHIGAAELIDAFENVGNHLFRLAKTLCEDDQV